MKILGRLALFAGLAVTMTSVSSPAQAGGCNGVVEWWTWGCAPWDNNNGPNFKYYKKRAVSMKIPSRGAQVEIKGDAVVATINGVRYPVVNGTAGLVAAGGGNLVAAGGGNLVAAGGGNLNVYVPQ